MDSTSADNNGAEYVRWAAPGLIVSLRRSAMDGIEAEAQKGLNALPKRGVEVGGLLLGGLRGEGIAVDDFEPVECEHRFGPSFRLSKTDLQRLDSKLLLLRGRNLPGRVPVGLYRSCTLDEFETSPEDLHLLSTYFKEPGHVLLLVQPNRLNPSRADFFLWRDGKLIETFRPLRFPFDGLVPEPEEEAEPARPVRKPAAKLAESKAEPAPQPVEPEPEPAPAERVDPRTARAALASKLEHSAPEAPPQPPRPPFRPDLPFTYPPRRREVPPERPRRNLLFLAVALAAVGGLLWYTDPPHWPVAVAPPGPVIKPMTPDPITVPQPLTAADPDLAFAFAAETAQVQPELPAPVLAPPPAPPPPSAKPEPPSLPAPVAIGTVLQRWAEEVRRGNIEGAARYYVPALQAAKRAEMSRNLGRYGRVAVNRITEVRVIPEGRDEAVATFRRHWETAGYRKYALETGERVRLRRTPSGWKIASEQETRLYWSYGGVRR